MQAHTRTDKLASSSPHSSEIKTIIYFTPPNINTVDCTTDLSISSSPIIYTYTHTHIASYITFLHMYNDCHSPILISDHKSNINAAITSMDMDSSSCSFDQNSCRSSSTTTETAVAKKKTKKKKKKKKQKAGGAGAGHARQLMRLSTDPQSVAARVRRHRISDRFKTLQSMLPGRSSKMNIVSMLEEAIHYVKFLKTHIIWLHRLHLHLQSIIKAEATISTSSTTTFRFDDDDDPTATAAAFIDNYCYRPPQPPPPCYNFNHHQQALHDDLVGNIYLPVAAAGRGSQAVDEQEVLDQTQLGPGYFPII